MTIGEYWIAEDYENRVTTLFRRFSMTAEQMVREHGPVWLMNHCKAHFQTTDKVLAAVGKSRADLPPEGQVTSAAARANAPS